MVSKHSVAATIEALAGYVEVHFGHDARLLRHVGYPKFEDIFVLMKGRHAKWANTKPPSKRSRPASVLDPFMEFLYQWLNRHIPQKEMRISASH